MTWFAHQKVMNRLAKHLGRGEHAEVVACAELLLRQRPNDRSVMSLMASSLERLGDSGWAANIRQQLLQIDPNDCESLYLLARYHERRGENALACELYERLLSSPESRRPLQDSDYRFLRLVARLFSRDPDWIAAQARKAFSRLDREATSRQEHARKFVTQERRSAQPPDA